MRQWAESSRVLVGPLCFRSNVQLLPNGTLGSPAHRLLRPTLAGKDGQPAPSKYDLVANLVHEGKAGQGQGTYRVHIHRKARLGRAWYGVG